MDEGCETHPTRRNRTMIDDRQGTPMTAAARPDRQRRLRPQRMLLPYAASLATLLTVTACSGGDPAPAATTPSVGTTSTSTTTSAPPSTTKASPTSTVDPVLAKIPAAARSHTQEGAEAFAQFYMEQVNRAFTTADPTLLAGLSASHCKTCSAFLAGAEDLRKKSHRHKGLSISVDGSPANSYSPKKAVVQIFVTQHSVPVIDKNGKKVEQTREGQGIFIATLDFHDHWIVWRLQVAK